MAEIYETLEKPERLMLVGVAVDNEEEMEASLDELEELASTAGAVTV